MVKVYCVVCFLFFTSAVNAFANDATKSEKINEFIKLQGLYEMIDQQKSYSQDQAKAIGAKMIAQLQQQFSELDPLIGKAIEKVYEHFLVMAKPTWTTDEAVGSFGKIYGSYVTETEIDKILTYYKSSEGQKDVEATKKTTPLWIKYLTDKNNETLQNATQVYITELKAIIDYAKIQSEQ